MARKNDAQLRSLVLATLAGGEMLHKDFRAAMVAEDALAAMATFDQMKKEGLVKQSVRTQQDGPPLLYVSLV